MCFGRARGRTCAGRVRPAAAEAAEAAWKAYPGAAWRLARSLALAFPNCDFVHLLYVRG